MEIEEVAEQISEFEEKELKGDNFRRQVALFISALAMVLAITALGGNKAGKQLLGSAISASDTWAFYQAKNIRQTAYQLAADELESFQATAGLDEAARQGIGERLQKYRATAARYESDTEGTGKKELAEKARHFEEEREKAEQREPYFDLAEALLQIAIVLASAAVTTNARFLVWVAAVLGGVGSLLSLDAFTLIFSLPF